MKLVSNQINPHFTLGDAIAAASKILGGGNPEFYDAFGTKNYRLTNTARSALGIIADVVPLDKSKRIALPAFICGVVATPFLQRGYQIEWIDTDANGVISVEDFSRKAKNVSLVVVPHIFGQPAPLKAVYEIAKQHNAFVVEDGAHLLNKNFDHCDVKIWSFGREKVISCVSGGALLWPKSSVYADKFKGFALKSPHCQWQIRHAIQPLAFALGQPWWHIGGKLIPGLLRKLNVLPLAVTKAERQGTEDIPVQAMGIVQARILKRQWQKQAERQKHAQSIVEAWGSVLPADLDVLIPDSAFRVIVRFGSEAEKFKFLKAYFSTRTWHLRDWDGLPISPQGVNLEKFGYTPGQCPRAEAFAQTHLTLPTNIRTCKKDIKELAK